MSGAGAGSARPPLPERRCPTSGPRGAAPPQPHGHTDGQTDGRTDGVSSAGRGDRAVPGLEPPGPGAAGRGPVPRGAPGGAPGRSGAGAGAERGLGALAGLRAGLWTLQRPGPVEGRRCGGAVRVRQGRAR